MILIIVLQVLTLLATVATSPLPSQDPLDPEISQTEDLAVDASNLQDIQSRVPTAVRLAILSAANAQPATVVRSPGYGKRSADDESEGAEDVTDTEDLAVEASSLQSSDLFVATHNYPKRFLSNFGVYGLNLHTHVCTER